MIILPILDLNECETHSPCNTEGTSDCENIPGPTGVIVMLVTLANTVKKVCPPEPGI